MGLGFSELEGLGLQGSRALGALGFWIWALDFGVKGLRALGGLVLSGLRVLDDDYDDDYDDDDDGGSGFGI